MFTYHLEGLTTVCDYIVTYRVSLSKQNSDKNILINSIKVKTLVLKIAKKKFNNFLFKIMRDKDRSVHWTKMC